MLSSAGRFPHRLTIQTPAPVQDQNSGEMVEAWADVGTVWARIEPMTVRSRELPAANQTLSEMYSKITVRWSPFMETITSAHRGVHQNTLFNFRTIAHLKLDRREIEILATSGVNGG